MKFIQAITTLALLTRSEAFQTWSSFGRVNHATPLRAFQIGSPADFSAPVDLSNTHMDIATMADALDMSAETFEVATLSPNLEDVVTPPTAPSPNVKTSTNKSPAWQQRFARRLNTHEDFLNVHKISGITWLVSLVAIIGTGACNQFSYMPDWLEIPTWVAVISSMVQAINGADMAKKYRANDPVMQKGMFNMSAQMVAISFLQVFLSPFAPEVFNDFAVGNGLMLASIAAPLFLTSMDVINIPKLIEARGLRGKEPCKINLGETVDALVNTAMVLGPLLLLVVNAVYAVNPEHTREWLTTEFYQGSDAKMAVDCYSQAFYNLALGVGTFALTLRDKKLISKFQEQALIVVPVLPALALTAHSIGVI